MKLGVIACGAVIADEKVIEVYNLRDHISPVTVAAKVGGLSSAHVREIRIQLRNGLADKVEKMINQNQAPVRPKINKAKKPKAPLPKVVSEKPKVEKVMKNSDQNKFTELEVLSVIAESGSRLFLKDVALQLNSEDKKPIKALLFSLRKKQLVDYKNPGTYSITLKGIGLLKTEKPDCKPSENSYLRANGLPAKTGDGKQNKRQQKNAVKKPDSPAVPLCPVCNDSSGQHKEGCRLGKWVNAVQKASQTIDTIKPDVKPDAPKESNEIAEQLAGIDQFFERQALQKLESQIELLDKIHRLTGKLAEEMANSLAEIKTFLGSND